MARNAPLFQYESRQDGLARQMEKMDREKSAILVELGRLEQEAEVASALFYPCTFSYKRVFYPCTFSYKRVFYPSTFSLERGYIGVTGGWRVGQVLVCLHVMSVYIQW